MKTRYNNKQNNIINNNNNINNNGFIYVMSNRSMPGLLKIGMTTRNPETRLLEANSPNTWIPSNFNLELAKKVNNPKQKEKILHNLLGKFTERINSNREFFRVHIEIVKLLFDLIDGEMHTNYLYETDVEVNYWKEEDDIY